MLDETTTYVAQHPIRQYDDASLLVLARERAAYLARASQRVSGSLNLTHAIRQSLRVTVPELADWAQVLVVGRAQHTYAALAAGDRPVLEIAESITVIPEGQRRVLATARPELVHVTDDLAVSGGLDGLAALIPIETMRTQVAGLRPADLLCVPLTARGTTFGTLTLVRRAGHGFAPEDVTLAGELATRIALALDAARRYAERSHIASVLQDSLRPPALPEVPGVQIATCYRPSADHETDIGGDFYDVWGSPDDWSLVIGDVSGKGVAAAVVTGQARHTVRGAAYVDRRPAAVLRALNVLLADTNATRFVTAFYARMRPAATGSGVDMLAGSAGHPPPLVLRADGSMEQLTARGIAAGVLPDTVYEETAAHLSPGDTLVCYTDGVTEAGAHSVRQGTDKLVELVRRYAGASVAALVEAVEMHVVEQAGERRDDMAVLAVRATR